MEPPLQVIKSILQSIINQIDNGSCNMSEAQILSSLDMLRIYANPEQKISKAQACDNLKISRATFDNWVKEGKIPKGRDQKGFKEKYWLNKDIYGK